MAKGKAAMVRKIRYAHVARDAVAHEIRATVDCVHFGADGLAVPEQFGFYAWRVTGGKREPLAVTSASEHAVWAVGRDTDGGEYRRRVYSSTVFPARVAEQHAPFCLELVEAARGSGYAPADVLAACTVGYMRDGTQGAFVSTAFKRSLTDLSAERPRGGAYDNPVPLSPLGWEDAPYDGAGDLWMTRARFTPDMTGDQTDNESLWSLPVPVADSTDVEFIWSAAESPAPPTEGVHPYKSGPSVNTQWTKEPSGAVWMAVALKSNSVWGGWNVSRIKGEKGEDPYTVNVSTTEVTFKEGKYAEALVEVTVFRGSEQLPYGSASGGFMCSRLSPTASESDLAVMHTHTATTYVYRLICCGYNGFDERLPFTVTLPDGSQRGFTLSVRTVADGRPGESGRGINKVTEFYLASALGSGVTLDNTPEGWSESEAPQLTAEKPYLWNYEETRYTDGSTERTDPVMIGTLGKDGRGIRSVTNYYLATSKSSGVTTDKSEGWDIAVQSPTAAKRYLWNYERVSYTDGSSTATAPHVIGVYGEKGDSVRGLRGPFTPPPMLWEDYPDGYEFQNGDKRVDGGDADRLDVVLMEGTLNGKTGMVPYSCRVSHAKSASHRPDEDNTETKTVEQNPHWTATDAGVYDIVATKVLLAAQAYISLLSSNGIRIYDSAGKVVGEISGTGEGGNDHIIWMGNKSGDNADIRPRWAVSPLGRHFFGGTEGQRIELDPVRQKMYVYNSAGSLVATHGGDDIDLRDAVPKDTVADGGGSVPAGFDDMSQQGDHTQTKAIANTVGSNGMLRVTVPAYNVYARAEKGGSGKDTPVAGVTLSADVFITRPGGSEALAESRVIASASTMGLASDWTSQRTSPLTLQTPLSKGDSYRVAVRMRTVIKGGVEDDCLGSASAAGSIVAEFVAEKYRADYAGNGLVISTNSENYLYALFDSAGTLHLKAVSDGKTVLDSGNNNF